MLSEYFIIADRVKKGTGTCSRNEKRCTSQKAGSRKKKQVSCKWNKTKQVKKKVSYIKYMRKKVSYKENVKKKVSYNNDDDSQSI